MNREKPESARLYSNNKGLYDHNPHCDRMRPDGNRHSYFLRAKAPRFMGLQASEVEDGELKKASPSSCKSFSSRGSKSDDEFQPPSEDEDLANCLVMLSNKSCGNRKDESTGKDMLLEKGMFQCKACKKVFSSHQALGGHRASHKKVKGCFASKLDGPNDEDNGDDDSTQEDSEAMPPQESDATRTTTARKRAKMHECSVCRRVFSSGQALGGHKRCHWLTTSSSDNAFISNFHDFQYDHRQYQHQSHQLISNKTILRSNHDRDGHQLDLNLNLPPALDQNRDHDKDNDDGTKSRYEEASTRLCLQQKNDEEMKLRKVSDLREMSMDGGWLQMGIASTTTEMR